MVSHDDAGHGCVRRGGHVHTGGRKRLQHVAAERHVMIFGMLTRWMLWRWWR